MNFVIFMFFSKVFNMLGLFVLYVFIFNEDLCKCFCIYMDVGELDMGYVFVFFFVEVVYSYGMEWFD